MGFLNHVRVALKNLGPRGRKTRQLRRFRAFDRTTYRGQKPKKRPDYYTDGGLPRYTASFGENPRRLDGVIKAVFQS